MPFCRKCGRRLPEYSETCTECGTSTTAPMVKIKKGPAIRIKAPEQAQTVKSFEPPVTIISLKPIAKAKAIKAAEPAKTVLSPKIATQPKAALTIRPKTPIQRAQPKLVTRAEPLAPLTIELHEIIKSNVSLKKDIITNPHDYELQTFGFDLQCPNGHFWPAFKALPVSNGRAFCLKCGERLTKPKRKKKTKYHRF